MPRQAPPPTPALPARALRKNERNQNARPNREEAGLLGARWAAVLWWTFAQTPDGTKSVKDHQ